MNKLVFTATLIIGLIVISTQRLYAQDVPPAVPMEPVQIEMLKPPKSSKPKPQNDKIAAFQDKQDKEEKEITTLKEETEEPKIRTQAVREIYDTITLMELFSSQYCAVCPGADRLLSQYINRPDVIALSCHTNAEPRNANNLALPFCASRQSTVNSLLNLGSGYVSQLMINGKYDALGFDAEDVAKTIAIAQEDQEIEPVIKLTIEKQSNNIFSVTLPDLTAAGTQQSYKIWLVSYDDPKTIKVERGVNTNKTFTYNNIVSKAGFLGQWNGASKTLHFDPKITAETKGFAVLVQNEARAHIAAAAKYEDIPRTPDTRLAQSNMLPMME